MGSIKPYHSINNSGVGEDLLALGTHKILRIIGAWKFDWWHDLGALRTVIFLELIIPRINENNLEAGERSGS